MFVEVVNERQAETVAALAREIWSEYYMPFLGKPQITYMLEKFQSASAIGHQVREGYRYFLMEKQGHAIGYIAVQTRGTELFLSKIYVCSPYRRKGYGKRALQFVERIARNSGCSKITLTVNKKNALALAAYGNYGFKNAGPLVQDIGNGFIMDDYVMEKTA